MQKQNNTDKKPYSLERGIMVFVIGVIRGPASYKLAQLKGLVVRIVDIVSILMDCQMDCLINYLLDLIVYQTIFSFTFVVIHLN